MEEKKTVLEGIVEAGFERIDKFNGRKTKSLALLYRKILNNLGEDPCREGLLETPERVAKAMQYFTMVILSNLRRSWEHRGFMRITSRWYW
jgi:GTP cyclohydrolase I